MSTNNPYQAIVRAYVDLLAAAATLPEDAVKPGGHPAIDQTAAKVLMFSPHPDDEVITGGLPLRLRRELKLNISNVAVTQGSRKSRQAERWRELQNACAYLDFGLLATVENGLEQINLATRELDITAWSAAVSVITGIIAAQQPTIIFLPHDDDWNRTHVGTHYLVHDALAHLPTDFTCLVVETEFWGAMATPNLLVESSPDDVAELVAALSLHRGEVARNPYHLRLPAWMIDNVRRGAELVLGQGETAPNFTFATPYRLRRWAKGQLQPVLDRGRAIACGDDLTGLFNG